MKWKCGINSKGGSVLDESSRDLPSDVRSLGEVGTVVDRGDVVFKEGESD